MRTTPHSAFARTAPRTLLGRTLPGMAQICVALSCVAAFGCGGALGSDPSVAIGPMPSLSAGAARVLHEALDAELAAAAGRLGLDSTCAAFADAETSDTGRVGLGAANDGSEVTAEVDLRVECADGRAWTSRERWSWLAPLDPSAADAARQHAIDEALRHAAALAVRRLAPFDDRGDR